MDIKGPLCPFRAGRNEVGTVGGSLARAYQLLDANMPSCLARKFSPCIAETVVAPHAGSIGTRVDMATVGAELLITEKARAQGSVLASLALREYRQAQMRGKSKSEWAMGEKRMRRSSEPCQARLRLKSPCGRIPWRWAKRQALSMFLRVARVS